MLFRKWALRELVCSQRRPFLGKGYTVMRRRISGPASGVAQSSARKRGCRNFGLYPGPVVRRS